MKFAEALIALDVAAAIPYAAKCNIRMTIYRLAAATLTIMQEGGEE